MTNLEIELEKLRIELAATKILLQEKELENKQNKEKLKIHEFIFSNLGLNIAKIKQFEDQVISYRDNHKKELFSDDINEQELAISGMQNIISSSALALVCGNAGDNVEYHEKILKIDFGDSWNLLDENSKSFLISAKVMFASMSENDKHGLLDYSGICLLVTKALELELFRVYFKEYIQFLGFRKIHIDEYPSELLDKSGSTIKPDHLFSLGLTIHIWGIKYNRIKQQFFKANNSNYFLFFQYAKEKLYDWSDAKIEEEIYKNALFIERTRIDYRNPSAHTGRLTKITCSECFDYIIDTEKQMRRLLENMNKRTMT